MSRRLLDTAASCVGLSLSLPIRIDAPPRKLTLRLHRIPAYSKTLRAARWILASVVAHFRAGATLRLVLTLSHHMADEPGHIAARLWGHRARRIVAAHRRRDLRPANACFKSQEVVAIQIAIAVA